MTTKIKEEDTGMRPLTAVLPVLCPVALTFFFEKKLEACKRRARGVQLEGLHIELSELQSAAS